MQFDLQCFSRKVLSDTSVATLVQALDQRYFTGTTTDFVGATQNTSGKKGMVPAPTSGQQAYYLRGDGQWAAIDLSDYVLKSDAITDIVETTNGIEFKNGNGVTKFILSVAK